MKKKIKITTLVQNTVSSAGLLAEHGLSFWIKAGSQFVLFDTGLGAVLLANSSHLGVPLENAGAIVLSHGHYDHTGGLSLALKKSPRAKVYAHPSALLPKYSCRDDDDGTAHNVGMSSFNKSKLSENLDNLVSTKDVTEIADGLFVTGEIPRVNDFEDTGGPFYQDEKCLEPDPLYDDQALFFRTSQGTVVLLGCAHAGAINTLNYIRGLTGDKTIYAAAGGMHLVTAGEERLARTVEGIEELGIERLYPIHCTGFEATIRLCSSLPGKCYPCPVGTSIEFNVI